MIALEQLARCFEAVIPGMLTTVSRDGVPNMIAVSHVHRLDDRHLALSRQFFRKTHANLAENPYAQVAVQDPTTQHTYRIDLRFDHEETSGEIFDLMSARVDAVASMTGMSGVFRMQAAVIFEVLEIEHVPATFVGQPGTAVATGLAAIDSMTQLRALRRISDCVRTSTDAETLLDSVLGILDDVLGFEHAMILLVDGDRLVTLASRGYDESGVGAEVKLGDGVIGTVASTRRLLRVASLNRELRYTRAQHTSSNTPATEIRLPGLVDAQSQLAIPLIAKGELLGVLAVESRHTVCYGERDEAFLDIVAGHVALGLEPLLRDVELPTVAAVSKFSFFPHDDCVFLDGQYLIRNIPGRILWKLLEAYVRDGREEFSNRELRLDTSLGLPHVRDNLESRLILLRKRLVEKCEHVRLVAAGRGRFRLEVRGKIELELRTS